MGAGAAILAFDVEFNCEVTAGAALLWSDPAQLSAHYDRIADGTFDQPLERLRAASRHRIATTYQWDAVTDDYERLIQSLAAR